MTREEAIEFLRSPIKCSDKGDERDLREAMDMAIKSLEQEQKIKVLNRDEAVRKLGTVDIYQARAWITLLNDLEYLKLKICEVEE